MKHLEEKTVILDKIRKLAQENKPFNRYSFYPLYSGQHMSYDWQECLDELESQGELIKVGDKYKLKEVTMEIPKVYKALVKTRDGRLVSIWADTLLDYHEGEVTYAPKGSMGIFIKTSSKGAKYNGMSNSKRRCKELNGTLVVHEATPLGNLCSKAGHNTFLSDDRYPAILLGKEVWRDEPKEEWVDVTRECKLEMSCFKNRISVTHGGSERVLLANKAYRWRCVDGNHPDPDYKVELREAGMYPCGEFRVFKKVVK